MNQKRIDRKRMLTFYGKNQPITGAYNIRNAILCENGTFVGKRHRTVLCFKGIPFAQKPIGKNRWKRPVPVEKNNSVYEAYYFGPSPIQSYAESEKASSYIQSEDCLYLNIWVNKKSNKKNKPVMVFIHGGSYGWGGTSDPIYDGYNFVNEQEDIILVTIAYRTGLFGFMDFSMLPGSEDYIDSCNLGLLDQIEALKWIQKNIAAFGGNPRNVTVFGESAGAGSVSLLPLIKESQGLFTRIIAQSGSLNLTFSKEECQYLTKQLIKRTHAKSMDDLLRFNEKQLSKVNDVLNVHNNFPQRDGRILPLDPYVAYKQGQAKDIDMILGTNADEARYWISEIGGFFIYRLAIPILYENNFMRLTADDKKRAITFLRKEKGLPVWRLTSFFTELLFRIPMLEQAISHTESGGKTFVYYWTSPSSIPLRKACHAVELTSVFNNPKETLYTGSYYDENLAKEVRTMWTNFARYGDPSTKKNIWPLFDYKRKTMIFGKNIQVIEDNRGEQRKQLTPLNQYFFNGSYSHMSFNVGYVRHKIAVFLMIIGGISYLIYKIRRRKS